MSDADLKLHVQGRSTFVADRRLPADALYAAVCFSPMAHGELSGLDLAAARQMPGVVAILTAADMPGENQIGKICPDEPLLAEKEVRFIGQPLAVVVAKSAVQARRAAAAIRAELKPLAAIFDAREAYAQGQLIMPSRTFNLGDVEAAWPKCDVVVEGRVDSGGQEHVYLETQGTIAWPTERGGVKLSSATQSPTAVQRGVAKILGLPMNQVEVDVPRLGGGFGGKEEQATPWACLAALAAFRTGAPVRLVLTRREDIAYTGKRHPYSADYRLGLARDGRILAYDVMFYQNAGASADLSPAILERTLFHFTNAYRVPNARATAASCRTNLPPNTAFRGFGGPQAMFVIEAAIQRAAAELKLDPAVIQEKNLLGPGDEFPYGMKFRGDNLRRSFVRAAAKYDLARLRREAADFNANQEFRKKGLAVMPVCFGISFTTTFLNQASALVHVYTDGSVSVNTAAVEMGQGINAKLREAAARIFSVNLDRIKIESTNTSRVANTSPTAASVGFDLNGAASRLACESILVRLKNFAAAKLGRPAEVISIRNEAVLADGQPTGWDWERLIATAYRERISLSAQAHYATPGLHFDRTSEKGEPFAYHTVGTAIVGTTLDLLRGTYKFDFAKIVHDAGQSLVPPVDLGQVEGGLVQGIGWLTMEELKYAPDGRMLTADLATYKIPDIYDAPGQIDVEFLEVLDDQSGPFNTKAIGEPPLMYGIGAYFALLDAIQAARPGLKTEKISAPLTSEAVFSALQANGD